MCDSVRNKRSFLYALPSLHFNIELRGEGGAKQSQSMHLASRAFISHLPESESDVFFRQIVRPFVYTHVGSLLQGGMRIVIAIGFCILLTCCVLVQTASAQVLLQTPGSLLGNPCPPRTVSRDGPALDQQGVGLGGAARAFRKDAGRQPHNTIDFYETVI